LPEDEGKVMGKFKSLADFSITEFKDFYIKNNAFKMAEVNNSIKKKNKFQ